MSIDAISPDLAKGEFHFDIAGFRQVEHLLKDRIRICRNWARDRRFIVEDERCGRCEKGRHFEIAGGYARRSGKRFAERCKALFDLFKRRGIDVAKTARGADFLASCFCGRFFASRWFSCGSFGFGGRGRRLFRLALQKRGRFVFAAPLSAKRSQGEVRKEGDKSRSERRFSSGFFATPTRCGPHTCRRYCHMDEQNEKGDLPKRAVQGIRVPKAVVK